MLYSFIKGIPLQITDYYEQDLRMRFLQNGDRAFKDNDNYILLDVPLHYEGARQLRAN